VLRHQTSEVPGNNSNEWDDQMSVCYHRNTNYGGYEKTLMLGQGTLMEGEGSVQLTSLY